MSKTQEPKAPTKSDLTYNDYLKVPELLSLQVPQSDPAHHDEMLFIVIHQAYELWFKLILHEIDQAMECMRRDDVLRTHHFVRRIAEIFRILVPQIHILETMTPVEFLAFRDRLSPASGFQSMQFREVEFAAGLKEPRYLQFFKNRPDHVAILEKRLASPDLKSEFYDLLRRRGYAIPKDAAKKELEGDVATSAALVAVFKPIYENPAKYSELYLLAESLVDLDQLLGLWREHHVRVVERIIGFKRGTGGSSGVEYLKSTTFKKCFPALWDVRMHLTNPVTL